MSQPQQHSPTYLTPSGQLLKQSHKKALNQTILLAFFFLFLTLTYSSFSTIITYIYEHQDGYQYLGPLLLVTNYGTFMFFNILAPFVKVSYKKQFIFAAICYTINYALQIPDSLDPFGIFLLVVGSMLGGVGAAVVWVSQGGFMATLFEKYNISDSDKGRYFGILNMIIFSNILLGSLVTTFGLGLFSDTVYFISLTLFGLLAVMFSSFFIEDVQNKKQTNYSNFNEQKNNIQNQLRKSNEDQSVSNNNQENNGFSLSKMKIFSEDINVSNSVKQVYTFSKKMVNFLPLIFTDGAILGFISASSTHLLPQDNYSHVQAAIFLVLLGLGAIIGGFFSGYLSDKIPIMKVGKSSILILGINMLSTLPLFIQLIQNDAYSYFLGFFWGFTWHYLDGWLWVVCGKIFNGKLQSFALNKFLHSMSFVIYQFCLLLYGNQDSLFFIEIFFIFLSVFMAISLVFIVRQQQDPKKSYL